MPRITQYNAPDNLGLRPSETGISATAGAARRLEGDYSQAAVYQEDTGRRLGGDIKIAGDIALKHVEQQKISRNAAAFAGLINRKTKEWDATPKDLNDPTVANRFLTESLEPDLEQFRGGFLTERGQQWAESHVDQFRKHMFTKTSADMATLAGQAAIVNHGQTVNSLSNTVRGDPASMDFALSTLESTIDAKIGASPYLKGADAGKLRSELRQKGAEEIVKSAALGYIEKTGQVPSWVTDERYSKYINGNELKQFAQAAKYYQRQNDIADKAARSYEEHAAKLKFNTAINELELSTLDPDTGLPVVGPQHIRKLNEIVQQNPLGASLEPGRVRTMQEGFRAAIERMNKAQPPRAQSTQVRDDLLAQIDAGEVKDGAQIYAASSSMRDSDFRYVMSAFNRSKTDAGRELNRSIDRFIKSVSPQIDKSNPLMGRLDQDGKANVDRLRWDLQIKIGEYQKAGKDPLDLMNPDKPDYMGGEASLQKYKKTLQESAADTRRRLLNQPPAGVTTSTTPGTPTPPIVPLRPPAERPLRKPGESPADYLRRNGMQ